MLTRKRNPLVAFEAAVHSSPDETNVDAIADHRSRTVEVANRRRILDGNQDARRRRQWLKHPSLINVHLVLRVHQKPVQPPIESGRLVVLVDGELAVHRVEPRQDVDPHLRRHVPRIRQSVFPSRTEKHWRANDAQVGGRPAHSIVWDADVGLLVALRGGREDRRCRAKGRQPRVHRRPEVGVEARLHACEVVCRLRRLKRRHGNVSAFLDSEKFSKL